MDDNKTYKVGSDVYDIPVKDVTSFLKDNPKAIETQGYTVGKDTFDIPINEIDSFLKDKPEAQPVKKKASPLDLASQGQTVLSDIVPGSEKPSVESSTPPSPSTSDEPVQKTETFTSPEQTPNVEQPDLTLQTPNTEPFPNTTPKSLITDFLMGKQIPRDSSKAQTVGEKLLSIPKEAANTFGKFFDDIATAGSAVEKGFAQLFLGKKNADEYMKLKKDGALTLPNSISLHPAQSLSTFLDEGTKDWKEMPEGVGWSIGKGILDIAPDIAATTLFPEGKVISIASKYGLKVGAFAMEQAARGYAQGIGESNGDFGLQLKMPIVNALEKGAMGWMYETVGGLNNQFAGKLADRLLPNPTATSEILNKALIEHGTVSLSDGLTFGGLSSLDELLRTGKITSDSFLTGFGMGTAFHLLDGGKLLAAKGYNTLLGLPSKGITDFAKSDMSVEDMNKQAEYLIDKVNNKTSQNPEADAVSAFMLKRTAQAKAMSEEVLNNKDEVIKNIKDDITDKKVQEVLIDKVNEVNADNDPKVQKTKDSEDKIAQIDDALKLIGDNKSWSDTRKEVESAPLKERKLELKDEVNKVYGIKPKEQPKGEDGKVKEKPKAVQTESSKKILGELDKPKPKDNTETPPIKEDIVPIREMNSEQLRNHARKIKGDLSKQEEEYFGKEGAIEYKQAQSISNSPTATNEQRGKAYETIDRLEKSLTKEQSDAFFGENKGDPSEIRDIASRVELVEQSENVQDLGGALKLPLLDFSKNQDNEGTLAVLNAAKKKAIELGVDPKEMLKSAIERIAKDLPDLTDAKLLADDILGKLITPTEQNIPQQPAIPLNTAAEPLSPQSDTNIPLKGDNVNNTQIQGENGQKQTAFEKREKGKGESSIEGRKDEVGKIVKGIIDKNPHFYDTKSEPEIINDAKTYIQDRGIDGAYVDLAGKTNDINELPVRHVARQILMQHFGEQLAEMNKMNDKIGANDAADKIVNLETKLQEEGRIGARTVRFTMWKLLNPQASVFMVDKLINQVNQKKLGFNEQGARDFMDTWKNEVPDMVKKLLTENEDFKNTVDKLSARVKQLEDKIGKATPRTTKEKANELAAKVRSLKTDNWGLTFADPLGATVILNGALELTAKTIETTGNVLQAIQDGMEHIKSTKWYRDLKEDERKKALAKFNGHIRDNVDFNAEDYLKNTSWFRGETKAKVEPTDEQKTTKELNNAKKEADDRLKDHIYDIVASHLLVDREKEEDLAGRLKRELGLTDKEAKGVADVALKSFKEGAQGIFDKTLKPKIKNEAKQQKVFDKFFGLIKRGVLNDATYAEPFAEKFGLRKNLTTDEKTELTRLGMNAQNFAPYGSFGDLAMNDFLQYTAKITDADNIGTIGLKLMNSLNYARMLSGPTTTFVNVSSAAPNWGLRPVMNITNLGRWADVLHASIKGDKERARLINPRWDMYYTPEAYKIGAIIGWNQFKNIVKHGDIRSASKYMEQIGSSNGINIPELEKNKYGVGARFKPISGKTWLNPFNSSKYSGRFLLAEDVGGTNIPFALHLALASRREAIKEGSTLSEKALKDKILGEIQGTFLTDEQSKDIESQLNEQTQKLVDAGIEPDEGQTKQRRFELVRSLLNLNPDVEQEALQLSKQDLFNRDRGGVFSTIGDAMAKGFNKNIVIKTASMGSIPFTTVLGHIADASVDGIPGYNFFRARGYSPTGIIARSRMWNSTGDWHDFGLWNTKKSPASFGEFKSAQMGEVGSTDYYEHMNRVWFATAITALGAALFLRTDPKDDPNPRWDITGGLIYSDAAKQQANKMGKWTMRIPMPFSGFFNDPKIRSKHIDIRYLNIPLVNFGLGMSGSYKDAQRAGAEGDDLLAKTWLMGKSLMHSMVQIKDTWIAKGIGDLTDLIGNIVKTGSIRGRQVVKDPNTEDISKGKDVVSQGVKTFINNYISMPFKAIDPLKSNMVQQIWKAETPEGRLTATPMQIMKYNLGIQNGIPFTEYLKSNKTGNPIGSNDLRTDIFGQVVKTLPGDQGIAWPRKDDQYWEKVWKYNINVDDVTPKDRIEVKGIYSTLEFDKYLQRKAETNELFKNRFDDYFNKLTPEELQAKSDQVNINDKTGVKTTQINDDINTILMQTKSDVKKKMFVWDKQAKDEPKLFDELQNDGVLPSFWNMKVTIGSKNYNIPFNLLQKFNDEAMSGTEEKDGFIKTVKDYLENGEIDADKVTINQRLDENNPTPTDGVDNTDEAQPTFKPNDSVYSRHIWGLWKAATAGFKERAKEEIQKTLPEKAQTKK